MAVLKVLVAAALLTVAGALRRGDPDKDNLVHEAVEHAQHADGAKPTDTQSKDFLTLDTDGDKQLSGSELMSRQFSTGCLPVEAQIRAMDYMICGDKDGNRALSEAEYKDTLGESWEKCVMGRADRRAHGFMRFIEADEDIDDFLSLTELRVALSKLWGPPGEGLAKPFMGCADGDKDGKISQEEFHDTISVYNPSSQKFQGPNKKVLTCLDAAMTTFSNRLAFSGVDANKDNKISKQEAYTALMSLKPGIKQATLEKIFDAADLNKDKYLSFEEFEKAGESHKGEGEAFFLAGLPTPVPLALVTGAQKRGAAAACGARPEAPFEIFASPSNATAAAKGAPAVLKGLVASNSTNLTFTQATLGPFDDKVAACKYCFSSFTKSKVVPLCTCTAFDGKDGPTMFCTATPSGIKYAASQDGGCKCNAKNMQQMGATTCDPF